jgi:glycosyltransferase involved in cell wall biosynthesis
VAGLRPEKRLKPVIWAIDILRCIRDDVHLLVMGDGPQRWQLERFARLCTLDTHVHFLGNRQDLGRILPHLDLVWHGGNREGMSSGLTEAMAAGVPVVASDTPANRELIIPGDSGFLVQTGNRAGLARHANKLLNDVDLRKRIGNAARERMTKLFPVEQSISRHAELYHSLLA